MYPDLDPVNELDVCWLYVCYRAPIIRFNERVYIPQEAHPEIGFIGMIIGPRGNSLRKIEKEVLCSALFVTTMVCCLLLVWWSMSSDSCILNHSLAVKSQIIEHLFSNPLYL